MNQHIKNLVTLKYVETQRIILAVSDCEIDLLPDLEDNDIEDVITFLPKLFPDTDCVRIRLQEYIDKIELELTKPEFEKISFAVIDFIAFLRYFELD